jgi:hypothetical protein
LQEHKDIVAALMRRDPVDAERKMRLHIGNARRYVEEQMKEAASRQAVAPAALKPKPKTSRVLAGKEGKIVRQARR